jgi:hypothetical protein
LLSCPWYLFSFLIHEDILIVNKINFDILMNFHVLWAPPPPIRKKSFFLFRLSHLYTLYITRVSLASNLFDRLHSNSVF